MPKLDDRPWDRQRTNGPEGIVIVDKPRYRLKFQFQIKGCVADGEVNDVSLLKRLSDITNEVIELKFYPGPDDKSSVLTGVVLSEDLAQGYGFITYKLRPVILESILLSDVECLDFDDLPKLAIENEEEMKATGFSVAFIPPVPATLVSKCPTIQLRELQDNLSVLLDVSTEEVDDALFWIYMYATTCGAEKGILAYDPPKQYQLLWSAFNAIYKLYGGRKTLARQPFMQEVVAQQMQRSDFLDGIRRLIESILSLEYHEKKTDVSQKLSSAMKSRKLEEVAEALSDCLYALRNSLEHGEAGPELGLARVGCLMLAPLVREAIRHYRV